MGIRCKRKVVPYKISMTCEKCGEGDMLPTNVVLTTYPPQYPHECDCCGHKEVYNRQYPYIEWVLEEV